MFTNGGRHNLIRSCGAFVLALLWSAPTAAEEQFSPPTRMNPTESSAAFDPSAMYGSAAPGGQFIPSSQPAPTALPPVQDYITGQGQYTWQLLPDGLMYPSYLAGEREARIGTDWVYDQRMGWLWNSTLGGRVALVRYGTEDRLLPQGVEFDLEGAAFPELQLNAMRDLVAVDFRIGGILTTRNGPWETKFGFDHVCSHLGDQYMLENPGVERVNFSRDCLVAGIAYHPILDVRLYGEVGYAVYTWGATMPWEFQFGVEYAPAVPTGIEGAPFAAINAHLRQEVNFGGGLTVQTGWAWRGASGHLFRIGLEYFNGKSEEYQFSDMFEQQVGVGMWYDF